MKIVIINGSPRIKGLTANILHSIEKELCQNGAEVEYFDLSKINMEMCMGCCNCYKNGKCMISDDVEKVVHAIESADGLVIGSPTYASNVSGILKTFIDRGHFVIEQLLYWKYAVGVSTGENKGSRDTSKILRKLFSYSGGTISGMMVYNAPFNSKDIDEGKIKKISSRLYCDISKRRVHIIQRLKHKIILRFGIVPFVYKKGQDYEGVTGKWEKYGIFNKRHLL